MNLLYPFATEQHGSFLLIQAGEFQFPACFAPDLKCRFIVKIKCMAMCF